MSPGCPPFDLQLVDCSGAVSSEWTVNGQAFSGDTVFYFVQEPGVYSIVLTSTFLDGTDTMVSYSSQFGPIGDFTFSPTAICQSQPSYLTFTSQGVASYELNIYNDQSSLITTLTPISLQLWFPPYQIAFPDTGCYSFETIFYDVMGCTDTVYKQDYVCVNSLTADFNLVGNDSISCPPLVASFENTSSCFATCDCVWDFGEGSALVTDCNPTHTYTDAGSFDVTLIVFCDGISDTIVKENYITVGGPDAVITALVAEPCGPATVCFSLDSTDSVSLLWCPGNGTSCITGFDTVCVNYDSLGVYNPTLLICDGNGCCYEKSLPPVYIDSVVADFSWSADTLCGPGTVQFSNDVFSATGLYTTHWDFGDGNTSLAAAPAHLYTDTGCYDVTFIATGFGGCADTVFVQNPVSVIPGAVADITSSTPSSCSLPHMVCFYPDASNIPGSAYSWYFNGGTPVSSVLDSPCVVYFNPGAFDVMLIATAPNGCSDTTALGNFVNIGMATVTLFASDTVANVGDTLTFTSTPGLAFFWSIATPTDTLELGAAGQEHELVFTEPGTYTVCVEIAIPGGCVAEDCVEILISDSLDFIDSLAGSLEFIRLLPIPANDFVLVQIHSQTSENVLLDVLTVNGEELWSVTNKLHQGINNQTLNVSGLPNGVYLLRLQTNTLTSTRKLVIQR